MENITDLKQYAVTGKFDLTTSIKADADSTESKTLTLRFVFNTVPLQDIVTKALSTARISWQNGPGRGKFDTWKDRSIIEVDFTSPAKKVKTRDESILELESAFMKAGLDKVQSHTLAVKAIDNPEVIN